MITAKELFDKMLEENDECTSTDMMIAFAKLHVTEALKKAENGNKSKPLSSSRLFKLRAWVRNEIMVNVVSIDFNNEFITWDDNQFDRCVPPNKCYEIETFDNIVLMQHTKLKDGSGIEIYEGDILKSKYHTWIVLGLNFCEGVFGITLKTTVMDKIYLADDSFQKSSEVIGNIYENPELLSTPTAVL